jgi:hypothetical protein
MRQAADTVGINSNGQRTNTFEQSAQNTSTKSNGISMENY